MSDATQADFLVYGASGYLGAHLVKWLEIKKKSFTTSKTRLQNREQLEKDLDTIKPKHVLCAAGLSGRPNIDWFETNKQEGIRVNVIGALNIVDLCFIRNIHCTMFGTGLLYSYDDKHPLGSGIGFKEDEEPNYGNNGPYYIQLRLILERLLKAYPNCLNLRTIFPVSDDFHERSLIHKLTKYAKIISIPNSFTVVDDLWPLLLEMAERNIVGAFNLANPGTISHNEILELFKKYIDPNFTWNSMPEDEVRKMVGRPNCELDVRKLVSLFPEGTIPHIKQSIEAVLQRQKANMEKHK